MHFFKIAALLAAILILPVPGHGASGENQRKIAVTIDDLPTLGHGLLSPDEQTAYFTRILDILDKNGIKTIGFVTGHNLNRATRPLLDSFVARGHLLGNHTFAHSDLNDVSASEFMADILRIEKEIPANSDGRKFFRYPMLHHGNTLARKDSVALFLKDSGYVMVPVTIDNDDWRFNRDYVQTFKNGDIARAEEIAGEYIMHMAERTEYFDNLGRKITGRPVSHILLLHMNYLNARCLNQLLDYYKAAGWEFITPEEALADSIYLVPDNYISPRGVSLLERLQNR